MHATTKTIECRRGATSNSRRAGIAAGLLALATAAAPVEAQWVVNDPPHTIKTVLGWIETHYQELREMQQWSSELDHYRQQLIEVSQYSDRALMVSDRFELRRDDEGLAEACPGASGRSLWPPFTLDPMGDIRSQQLELCGRIVLAKNARYNEQVRMLQRIRDDDRALQQLARARGAAGDRQGALAANDNDVARLVARAGNDLQHTQSVLVAYDGYIADLGEAQATLSRRAMAGATAGGLVQGIALKAALEAARIRDR